MFLCAILAFSSASGQAPVNPQSDQLVPKLSEAQDETNRPAIANDSVVKQCRAQLKATNRERELKRDAALESSRNADATAAANLEFGSLKSFGCKWGRLKLDNSAMATEYFGGLKVGNTVALSLGQKQDASLYTELLSDNLWLSSRLGYARLGFSTQVSAAKDSAGKTTVDQFFNGGGNAVLYAALPSFVYVNFVREDTAAVAIRRIDSFVTLAIAADAPSLSTPATENAWNGRLGYQGGLVWSAAQGVFRLVAQGNAGLVYGSSTFFRNIEGSDAAPAGFMAMIRGIAGVDLAKRFRIGVSAGASTRRGVNQKPSLSVQLLQ